MTELLGLLQQIRWQDLLDIALVAFVVYQVILLVRGTRAMNMLYGLGLILVVWFLSRELDMLTTRWILQSFLSSLVVVLIVLFQADIRKALARMGQGSFFSSQVEHAETLEEVVRATFAMASRKTGALIVLERQIGLADYVEGGVVLDARVSRELLISIFQVSGPLHDGAVVIRGELLEAARVMLPLTKNPSVPRYLGSRHRAALGITEETDTVAVVVSEERGRVGLAVGGKLTHDLDAPALRNLLGELLQQPKARRKGLFGREKKNA